MVVTQRELEEAVDDSRALDLMLKQYKKENQKKYMAELNEQVRVKSQFSQIDGSMSIAEKEMNERDLLGYKSYDTRQYATV